MQQVSQGTGLLKKSKKAQQKLNNMLQGLMFLPDGRVLIMDSELYKQTIEKSIVLDLFEGTSLSSSSEEGMRSATKDSKKQGQRKKDADASLVALDVEDKQEERDFLGMLNVQDFSDITLMVDGKPIYSH